MTRAETERIKARYSRRDALRDHARYDPINPAVLFSMQERERALWRILCRSGIGPIETLRVLEIGCGTGANLLQLLRLGFQPENLKGNDLLSERIDQASRRLPPDVELVCCDALDLDDASETFDIVLQSTVFTSIAEPEFQEALARQMWRLVAPGGAVLWYDFAYDNPQNRDVHGVKARRIRELFPNAAGIHQCRITLAPPISRAVTKIHPRLYSIFNTVPILRTHILAWIEKAPSRSGL